MLLYTVDRPTVPPTRVRLLGHDVHVLELDLDRPWQRIEAALHEIVARIAAPEGEAAGHASPTVT